MKNRTESMRKCGIGGRMLSSGMLAFLAFSVSASETRTVGTATDLREALAKLNGNAANTIVLQPGNYDVSSFAMYSEGEGGTAAHLLVTDLTLKGESSDPRDTVIYGNGSKIVIRVGENGGIHNLTVSNGYNGVNNSYGAGVSGPLSGKAVCSNMVFTCNSTPNSNGGGGAGFGYCYDSEFCFNNARHGGGLAYVTVATNCFVHHNTATQSGGGMLNVGARGCDVLWNSADRFGGMSSNSDIPSWGCNVISNTAATYGGGGGSISGSQLQLEFRDCTFAFNSSGTYGGGCAYALLKRCLVHSNIAKGGDSGGGGLSNGTALDSVISNNTADVYGGGAFRTVLSNCLVACNSAQKSGGGVAYSTVMDSVVSNNVASLNGGGAYNSSLTGSDIIFNSAAGAEEGGGNYGGGVAGAGAVNSGATNCLIACNYSANHGAGAGNSTLSGCVVSNNLALLYGGGVYKCTVADSSILHNIVSNEFGNAGKTGNAFWALGAGAYQGSLTNCLVSGNAVPNCGSTQMMGGGGYETKFWDCRILNNFAKAGGAVNGGELHCCVISNNATSTGNNIVRTTVKITGCDIYGATLTSPGAMMNCSIRGVGTQVGFAPGENVCEIGTFNGVPVDLMVNSQTYRLTGVTNCLFAANAARCFVSGDAAKGNPIRFVNCTFADNRFENTFRQMSGGADHGNLTLVNCIFAKNLDLAGTSDRHFRPAAAATDTSVSLANCLIQGGIPSGWTPAAESGTLDAVPGFAYARDPADPYTLKHLSPGRGAGLLMDWMYGATDVRGSSEFPRLRDGKVDIGCYQCWLQPIGTVMSVR